MADEHGTTETDTQTETETGAVAVDRLRLVLLRLARRIRSQYTGQVTPSQVAVLATLARQGPATVGEIARHEQVKPPSASRIVAALETQRLVERRADPDDRRCARIGLTADGERLVSAARLAGATWLASRLDALDDAELAVLGDALPVLERVLGTAE